MAGKYTYDHPRPMVTADAVLLRVAGGLIKTLLVKRGREPFKDTWAFPGGFINIDERLSEAAARELREETGVENVMLEAFGAFDTPGRDPRGRVISFAHIGLVCDEEVEVKGGDDASEAAWFPISATPELAFDHSEMLETALEWLAARLGVGIEEPHCFLTMPPEEQAVIRGCLAEIVREREKAM